MIIAIKLLLNQYQANAWHHAHCEGVIDWPPAPWRILRAIVAGSYNVNLPRQHQNTLKQLLHKMAQVQPCYHLPKGSYIQYRSPRPQVDKQAKIKPGKTLYAAGLLMAQSNQTQNYPTIFVQYDIELSEIEDLVLRLIMGGITYLGRKESAAEWMIVEELSETLNAHPNPNGTQIVAIPSPNLDVDKLWEVLNLSAADVFDKDKKAVFSGVEHTTYQVELDPKLDLEDKEKIVNTVRLQVIGENHKIPRRLAHLICDLLHKELVSCDSRRNKEAERPPAPVFTGQDFGKPRHSHDHTFIQPIFDSNTGRYIEMLSLFASQGYTSGNLATISSCQKIYLGKQLVKLQIVDYGQDILEIGNHHLWKSLTPMFLTRFPQTLRGKTRYIHKTSYQKDCPEHQALKYLLFLEHLGLSGKPHFEAVPQGLGMFLDGQLAVTANCEVWDNFWEWTSQRTTGKKIGRIGYKVNLEFQQPVRGPIGLGYACHYGLGAMQPLKSNITKNHSYSD